MSLDIGTDISERAAHLHDQLDEEAYCQFAAERFQAQWQQNGVFTPAALRQYGVRGELSLPRCLHQAHSFAASFAIFPLGPVPPSYLSPLQQHHYCLGGGDLADTTTVGAASALSSSSRGAMPFSALAFGQYTNGTLVEPEAQRTRERLHKFFHALQVPSTWARGTCAAVTVPGWDSEASRKTISEQLELASFLGVQSVLVPLPCVAVSDVPTAGDGAASSLSPAAEQQQAVLLCQAADLLRGFLRSGSGLKIWVSCDGCVPLHRRWFQMLLHALCYGYEVDATTGRYTIRAPTTHTVMSDVFSEALMSLSVYLYFGNPESLLPTAECGGQILSPAWLGEDVVAFDVPPALLLREHLLARPACETEAAPVAATHTPEWSPHSLQHSAGSASEAKWSVGEGSEPAHALDDSDYSNLLNASWESGKHASHATPAQSSDVAARDEAAASAPAEPAARYTLPMDVIPVSESRWGGEFGPHSRLGAVAFVVELLRKRAVPVFRDFFFDHYALLNYLSFKAAVDVPRDVFRPFEDTLQLPLQPLGHQLSSVVYEIFERDSRKYSAYRDAFYAFVCDWLEAGPSHWHGTANAHLPQAKRLASASDPAQTEDPTLYVVLLGSGRGPFIDECLSAASSLGVRLRVFALEKNVPALTYTRLRVALDPEWAQLTTAFGHSVEVIEANGRTVFDNRDALDLPDDFGLCDVVMSELLGSFGDNELSPECIEDFHDQLCKIQALRGMVPNAHMVSIPQSYTAWVAPLHSARLEQSVAEASIKGLTVRPEACPDPHAALYHSYFVCNVTRGALLAAPQPCWTFEHDWSAVPASAHDAPSSSSLAKYERVSTMHFRVSPLARCSGLAGFFNAVLYKPRTNPNTGVAPRTAVELSILPGSRTQDMYSWFPCLFALDPAQAKELSHSPVHDFSTTNSKSGCADVSVRMRRCREAKRAWYTWQVAYTDSPSALDSAPPMNEGGWASTIYV